MENKTQDYQSEILDIIRGNTSPGVMRNKLEDYHENDLADVFSELTAARETESLQNSESGYAFRYF